MSIVSRSSIAAEWLLARKRVATWVIVAIAMWMSVFFGYILPYVSYRSGSEENGFSGDLNELLPRELVVAVLGGFPFFLGVLALILGAMLAGGDFGWGTLKTTLMQHPDRRRFFVARLVAIAALLGVLTLAVFVAAVISSLTIALVEDAAVAWPGAGEVVQGLATGWLILTLWAIFGVLLAVLFRGTTMAVGLGILYGLVIEGLVSGFGNGIALLNDAAQGFLRTNAYSLVAPLGVAGDADAGPGSFTGPFVDPWQALAVVVGYVLVFATCSMVLLQRRDVA